MKEKIVCPSCGIPAYEIGKNSGTCMCCWQAKRHGFTPQDWRMVSSYIGRRQAEGWPYDAALKRARQIIAERDRQPLVIPESQMIDQFGIYNIPPIEDPGISAITPGGALKHIRNLMDPVRLRSVGFMDRIGFGELDSEFIYGA